MGENSSKNDHNSKKKIGRLIFHSFHFNTFEASPPTKKKTSKGWIFFYDWKENSNVVKFTWKMQKVLNRKKNHFSYFSDFHFELWSFLYSNHPYFRLISTITRKMKIGKFIFHSILGGVCISLLGTGPAFWLKFEELSKLIVWFWYSQWLNTSDVLLYLTAASLCSRISFLLAFSF